MSEDTVKFFPIPEHKKRQGWKRKVWGYSTVTAASGNVYEVDAFPGNGIFWSVFWLGYCIYSIGFFDTMIVVAMMICAAGAIVFGCVAIESLRALRAARQYRRQQEKEK